jgi:hypothetical protein
MPAGDCRSNAGRQEGNVTGLSYLNEAISGIGTNPTTGSHNLEAFRQGQGEK